jgi:zinc protease
MKTIAFICSFVLMLACSCSYKPPAPVKDLITGKISMPKQEEAINFTPKEPVVWYLENGMKVLYIFNDELPLVRGSLIFKGGEAWEEDNDFGSASVMTAMLRKGGAGNLGPKELDRRLEELSAKISSSMNSPLGTISFKCLDSNLGDVWGIFSDVILRPRFDYSRLALLKDQLVESLKRREDEPQVMADISLDKLIFGDSILGRSITSQNIRAVSTDKVKKAYARFVRPENSLLIISGRVTRSEIEDLLDDEFVHLRTQGEPLVEPEVLLPPPRARIVYVPADISQATVAVGQLGVPFLTSDDFGIKLFNEIFSGSMDSRLFKQVRTEAGLAYAVWGGIVPNYIMGKNSFSIQTRSSQVGQAVLKSLQVLKKLQQEDVGLEELNNKKLGKAHSFLFSSASPEVILSRRAMLEMLGFPESYDENYLQNIESVTTNDVRQVANKRWDDSSLIFLIIGDQEALDSFLKVKGVFNEPYRSLPVERGYFNETFYLGSRENQ